MTMNKKTMRLEAPETYLKRGVQTTIRQRDSGNPRQVKVTFDALRVRQGLSELEAIHRIDAVLVESIWEMLSNKKVFNEEEYNQKLMKLAG